MPYTPFDPTKAVTFDLPAGQVRLQQQSVGVIVPADALGDLCGAMSEEQTRKLGLAVGSSIGRRVAARLSDAPGRQKGGEATVEQFAEHLAGEFAVMGLGRLGIERWGRALVWVVDHGTLPLPLIAVVLGGALEVATGRSARCVKITQGATRSRFVVVNAAAADRVQNWLREGVSWGEVLVRLHGSRDATERGGEA